MGVQATDPVTYRLSDARSPEDGGAEDVPLNPHLGQRLRLRFVGERRCTLCGRVVKKLFGPGCCFPCFRDRPEADGCIVRPHECHFFDVDNPCRDDGFAMTHCFQPHVLYVAVTSGVKVGITREVNVPTRWIDQGAVAAVPLATMGSRREVGLAEHALRGEFADRTHWITMLKTESPDVDLPGAVAAVAKSMEAKGIAGLHPPAERPTHTFRYPMTSYPEKVQSFQLDKVQVVEGTLTGIKGQYLVFDSGVINLRRHAGYTVEIATV